MSKAEKVKQQDNLIEFSTVDELINFFQMYLGDYRGLKSLEDKEEVVNEYKYHLNYLCGWGAEVNYNQKLYNSTLGYIIRNVKEYREIVYRSRGI